MNKWKRNVVIISAAILFSITSCLGLSAYKRHRASALLNEVVCLRLGAATFSDAQRLAEQFGGSPGGPDSEVCSSRKCHLKFVFYNTLLNHVQNRRQVSLAVGLTVENGYVIGREIDYSIVGRAEILGMYVVSEGLRSSGASTEVKRDRIHSDGKPHWVKVALNEDATRELRERAYSLNLACIARLFGCNSLSDVVPTGL